MTNLMKSALLLVFVLAAKMIVAQNLTPGFAALQLENWDEAIKFYSALVQKNPADEASILRLGDAYLAKGDKTKALETFDKAFAVKGDGAFAFIANGRALLLKNMPGEVDRQFIKAAKAGKKDVNVLRAIGESYLYGATRNLPLAEKHLKAAYEKFTSDFQTLMQLGYCYKEMPNGGLAAQHYEFAQQSDPSSAFAIFMQARVYRQAKIPEKYILYLEKTLAKDPGFTLAHRETAEYWYFTKRNYAKATEAYENLLAKAKEPNVEDEMQLANCYFLSKKYDKCIALVEKIIGKDGSKNYLRRLLGYCYYETGDFAKAKTIMTDYFKVVTPDKILASDYEYLARTTVKTGGDTLQAIETFRKAIALDPLTWPDYKEIGALQYKRKDYCNAAISYQMYLDSMKTPEATDYFYLGNCQYYCKADTTSMRYEKALASYKKVAEMVPTATLGWFWSGKAAAKLDVDIQKHPDSVAVFGKAQPYFEKFIEVAIVDVEKNKKDLITAYEYLSYMYYLKGDVAKFQEWNTKLLGLDPTNATGKGLLDDFNSRGGVLSPAVPTPPPSNGNGPRRN